MAEKSFPFLYRVHGLTIASDVEFPELVVGSGDADVVIRRGSVPERLDGVVTRGVLFEARPDTFLLRITGIANYFVTNGREIVIDATPDAPAVNVRTMCLGSVFTALLHQRGSLVLHAAAVAGANGAVVLAGQSGQGKSTLLAALARRGHRILADDAAVVTRNQDGGLLVHPGFPQIRLWRDAVMRLGHTIDQLSRAATGIEKYSLPVDPQFHRLPQPPASVFVLGTSNGDVVRIDPVATADRFAVVRAQTRNIRILEGLRMQVAHFHVAAAVACRVPIARAIRPRDRDSVDELVAHLEPALQ